MTLNRREYVLFNELLQAGWQNEELREALSELVRAIEEEDLWPEGIRALREAKRVLAQHIHSPSE